MTALDFKHSTILEARIAGHTFAPTKNNISAIQIITYLIEVIGAFTYMEDTSLLNIVLFKKNDKGYKYYPNLKVSIQGMSKNVSIPEIILKCHTHRIPFHLNIQMKDGHIHEFY